MWARIVNFYKRLKVPNYFEIPLKEFFFVYFGALTSRDRKILILNNFSGDTAMDLLLSMKLIQRKVIALPASEIIENFGPSLPNNIPNDLVSNRLHALMLMPIEEPYPGLIIGALSKFIDRKTTIIYLDRDTQFFSDQVNNYFSYEKKIRKIHSPLYAQEIVSLSKLKPKT